jgi:predicted  nucleic acid-binding Zn-ribbon protein
LSFTLSQPHKRTCEAEIRACADQVDEGKANAEMKDEEIAAIRRDLQQCQTQLSAQVEAATAAQAAAAAQTAKLAEKTTRLAHLEGRRTPRTVTLPTMHALSDS